MKKLNLLLPVILLTNACGNKTALTSPIKTVSVTSAREEVLSEDVLAWKSLVNSQHPNLALAEILAPMVKASDPKATLFTDDYEAVVQLNQLNWKLEDLTNRIARHFVYRNTVSTENTSLAHYSLFGNLGSETSSSVFVESSKLETNARFTGYIRSESLNEITTSFDSRMNELMKPLAISIAKDLAADADGAVIERLVKGRGNAERIIDTIQKSAPYAKRVQAAFAELNTNEQYFAVVNIAIAGIIYSEVKKHESFKDLLRFYKDFKVEINELKTKMKEVKVLGEALHSFHETTKKSVAMFNEGISGIKNNLHNIKLPDNSSLSAKKTYLALYDHVIKGKPAHDTEKPLINTKNIQTCLTAVTNINNSLSNVLQITESLSKSLGVELPPSITKIMNKSAKVASTLSAASSILSAASSGGALGAISALSGSMGLMKDPMASKLAAMDGKLDAILENQKKMMELQLETMKMIKNLALMVDQYHQQNMEKLREIRDISLTSLSIAQRELNENIRGCEEMLRKGITRATGVGENHIPLLSYSAHNFFAKIGSLKNLTSMINDEDNYYSCLSAMNDAFGPVQAETPVKLSYTSTDLKNFKEFERESYDPLLHVLNYRLGNMQLPAYKLNLNVPMRSFPALRYRFNFVSQYRPNEETYTLSDLYSIDSFERYVAPLFLLYPILDLKKEDFTGTLNELIGTALQINVSSQAETKVNFVGFNHLKGALFITQSIIAQEALLAGEPILNDIYNLRAKIFSSAPCRQVGVDVASGSEEALISSIRGNPILMGNLLTYGAWKQSMHYLRGDYKKSLQDKNVTKLAEILAVPSSLIQLDKESEELVIKVPGPRGREVAVSLPSSEVLFEGTIRYGDNMLRAIKIQERILDAFKKLIVVDIDASKYMDYLLLQGKLEK